MASESFGEEQAARIALGGVELGYGVRGAGSGERALVFVHGYAFRSTAGPDGAGPYGPLLALLAQRRRVYAVDLRGHGASAQATTGWSKQALADDIIAFCRALGLDRPVLVGHSFGCEVGILAAAEQPELFSALCLLTPGPADPRRDPVTALEFLIEHGRDRDAVRHAFAPMFQRPAGPVLDTVLDAVTLVEPGVHRAQRRENSSVSIEDRLAEVTAPALTVLGARDTVVSPQRQHEMARQLVRGKEVCFSAEGHMMPQESPTTAAREILAFLEHDTDSPSLTV